MGEVSQELQERRAYLGSYADRYFGTGLWATATRAADSRAVAVSEEAYGPGGTAGSVAGWGMITEGGAEDADGADALLGVRLKTTGKAISEIETLVVRRAPFGRTTFPERLLEPSAAMAQILEPADRGTREDLVRAANGYLDGVSRDDAGLIPAADDCVRIENGLQTVLNPDADGFPETFVSSGGLGGLGLGVRAQIRTLEGARRGLRLAHRRAQQHADLGAVQGGRRPDPADRGDRGRVPLRHARRLVMIRSAAWSKAASFVIGSAA